ncbi:hypothetical protein ACFSC4_09985 [Deinococcus malanensis]|uniref:hypothetical protein n=1 Tax=Deinococcus malanensis TaxID=1706855 RepID=UPI00363678DF
MTLTLRSNPVIAALLDHPFPDGFCQTLATTHHWTGLHASLVLTEYRRFLALAALGPAAPSRHVTMAHDLHRSVAPDDWQTLVNLAGDPLRSAWAVNGAHVYTDTLDRYSATFGHPAPANVWHDPRVTPGRTLSGWVTRHARTLISVALAGVMILLVANQVLPTGAAILLGFGLVALLWELSGACGQRLRAGQCGRTPRVRASSCTAPRSGLGAVTAAGVVMAAATVAVPADLTASKPGPQFGGPVLVHASGCRARQAVVPGRSERLWCVDDEPLAEEVTPPVISNSASDRTRTVRPPGSAGCRPL